MTTLILEKYYSHESNHLWAASVQLGWDVVRDAAFVPVNLEGNLVFYGSSYRMDEVAKELGYRLISPDLDWLCHIPEEYLGRKVSAMTWGEAKESKAPGFYKPANDKWFKAGIYDAGTKIEACSEQVAEHEIVIWSEPVKFLKEYRFFIKEREVMTGCLYAIDGKLSRTSDGYIIDEEGYPVALAMMREICNDERVKMPESLVIDIGVLDTGEWVIVEANCSYAAGIYACEPKGVLLTLEKSSIRLTV